MATTRLLLVLLTTLLLLADGLAMRHAEAYPHPSAALLMGLVLGQVGLIASWAACARRSWMARSAIAWACAALAAWPLSVASGPDWKAWAGLLLVYSAVVAIAWKLVLAAGYRWTTTAAPSDDRSPLRHHQFSLRWLLQLSTASCLALGIMSWLALPTIQPFVALASIMMLALCVPIAMGTLLVQTPRWWLRAFAAILMPFLGWLFVLANPGPSAMLLTLLLGTQLLVTILAATVLSVAGVALAPVTASTAPRAPAPPLRLAAAL